MAAADLLLIRVLELRSYRRGAAAATTTWLDDDDVEDASVVVRGWR